MATKNVDTTRCKSVLSASGLNGKTVTDVIVTQHGSVTAIEIVYSTGSQFVKERSGLVEVGGTIELGTGTAAF